jgi:hypothetical protein
MVQPIEEDNKAKYSEHHMYISRAPGFKPACLPITQGIMCPHRRASVVDDFHRADNLLSRFTLEAHPSAVDWFLLDKANRDQPLARVRR